MGLIKIDDSTRTIPKGMFKKCIIDDVSMKEIRKMYPTRDGGAYLLEKFQNYLIDKHQLSLKEYICEHILDEWPKCPVKNVDVGFKINGSGVVLSRFSRGGMSKDHCENFKKGCEKLSKDRMGSKNPMFGKKPWNKGLDISDSRVKLVSEKITGRKVSEITKEKQRQARRDHPLKARHTTPHTEESKDKMRQATIGRWERGEFSNHKTSIEEIVERFLKENGYDFKYQSQIGGFFVADFVNEKSRIIIEVQGDWFHCNPKIKEYKEPKYAVQKRNVIRDKRKRDFYSNNDWILIEIWENDINSGKYKEELLCELKLFYL